jgi:hypothetical protein
MKTSWAILSNVTQCTTVAALSQAVGFHLISLHHRGTGYSNDNYSVVAEKTESSFKKYRW